MVRSVVSEAVSLLEVEAVRIEEEDNKVLSTPPIYRLVFVLISVPTVSTVFGALL
jgi:hypothetical protein